MTATHTAGGRSWVPDDDFGDRLVKVRRKLKLTQREAAARCGIKQGTWDRWEHGVIPHDMAKVVQAIHLGLGADPTWLMWGDDRGNFAKPGWLRPAA